MWGGIQAGQRCRLWFPNRPCPISLIDVGNFVPLLQVCASFDSNMDCEYLRCWRCTTDAWPGKVAPVQRRLTLPFVDRFPAWLQKSSPGSGSWEPDYPFRSLSWILFILGEWCLMMRTGGSIQIKAKLFCKHLSSLLSQLIPLAFVQDQVENQLSLKSVFLVQRNLVTNICFSVIKIIRCVLLERELGVSWRAQKSWLSSESRFDIMAIISIKM